MARRVRTIVVIVTLGAIVNVAVAWGLVWSSGDGTQTRHYFQMKWRIWDYVTFDSWTAFGRARAQCDWDGPDANVMHVNTDMSPSYSGPPLRSDGLDDITTSPIVSGAFRFDQGPLQKSVVPKWAEPALPRLLGSDTACYMRIWDLRGWPFLSMVSECDDVQETGMQAGSNNFPVVRHLKGCIALPNPPNKYWPWWESPRLLPLRPLWPGFAINTMLYAATLWLFWTAPFALRRRRRIKRHLCPACAYPVGDSPICTECGAAVQPRRIPIPS